MDKEDTAARAAAKFARCFFRNVTAEVCTTSGDYFRARQVAKNAAYSEQRRIIRESQMMHEDKTGDNPKGE